MANFSKALTKTTKKKANRCFYKADLLKAQFKKASKASKKGHKTRLLKAAQAVSHCFETIH